MRSFIRLLPVYVAVALLALVLYAPAAQAGGGHFIKSTAHARGGGHASFGLTLGKGKSFQAGFSVQKGGYKGGHVKAYGGWKSKGHVKPGYGKPTSYGGFTQKSYGYGGSCSSGYGPKKIWVPGAWTLKKHKVWVPGSYQKVWHPPVFETHLRPCGTPYQVQVSPGYYEQLHTPGYWKWESQRIWVPAHWSTSY